MSNQIITCRTETGWFFATSHQGTPQNELWAALAELSGQSIPSDPNDAISDIAIKGDTVTLAWLAYPTAV